jgi:hypothetical protein
MKINCWEFMKCGRESSGPEFGEQGVCPACKEIRLNGVHGGKNAGRSCWAVRGTMCGGKGDDTSAGEAQNCLSCDFYTLVYEEEADDFLFGLSPESIY